MAEILYCNRRAHRVENELLHVTVSVEGGHVAEIFHKPTGVNPLWSPPWPSIDPSTYDEAKHPEYGGDAESKLLAGILGHNLCLDLFGPPSAEEAAAGMTVHGEASTAPYEITTSGGTLTARCTMPVAQLAFEREIRLKPNDPTVYFTETVENLGACDRPVAWTQHVTLGPPFLVKGETQFRAPATKSKTIEGVDFMWPMRPHEDGPKEDLQLFTDAPESGGFTTHLMDPNHDQAYFLAWSPSLNLLFGYRWQRSDFPWLGIWEENYSRKNAPWNGKTLTRGMEFGASPMPECRRKMIDRGTMFGERCYRWIPARGKVTVSYSAFARKADSI